MDIGLALAVTGTLLMAAGILLISKQQQKKEAALLEAEEIEKKLVEVKLVERDLQELLKVATMHSEDIVNKIQHEVAQAKETLSNIEEDKKGKDIKSLTPNETITSALMENAATASYYQKESIVQRKRKNTPKDRVKEKNLYLQAEVYIQSLNKGKPQSWSKAERYAQIPPLQKIGIKDSEIAQLLHIGLGELQLINQLSRRA
ncbi:hypothetical protein [Heliorestis convoluta]|uniref:Uncharacterized protein n=1 Tax=Heliorestis convoluta TaxID=356322 RepID=A0A5Q2MZK4_9FIRM|nr:hypothetical protein [Heliorestis convoluta]QGG48198.1 hypothetical protein FTV88_2100 [Heliorestis convoluta]